jgi:glutathione S-transferase
VWQLHRALRAVEKALATRVFIAGDAFSAADILATHCMTWALSAKLEVVGEKSLAYIERMKDRPAFQRAVARETKEAEDAEAASQGSTNTNAAAQ